VLISTFVFAVVSSCVYPSRHDSELTSVDTNTCFSKAGVVSEGIFADLEFGGNGLSWVLSSNPHGVYYVRRDGLVRQTHWIDNGPDDPQEGLIRVVQDGKYGFMDTTLAIKIKPRWDFAFPFESGVSSVCNGCSTYKAPGSEYSSMVGGKWFSIDKKGRTISKKR